MMRHAIVTILITTAISLTSCEYGLNEFMHRDKSIKDRAENILFLTNEKLEEDEMKIPELSAKQKTNGTYNVILITDVHFGGEKGKKTDSRKDEKFISKIKELCNDEGTKPRFCINLGDSTEHGRESEYIQFDKKITQSLEKLGIKTYNIAGNHDLYNSGWENYTTLMYPYTSFFSFKTENISFYFLDTASGSLGHDQFSSFKTEIQNDKDKKIVFSHFPIYAEGFNYFVMQNTEERNLLISLLAKNNTILFVDGHTHEDKTSDFGKFTERNIPGYLEKSAYSILTVNETEGTASIEVCHF